MCKAVVSKIVYSYMKNIILILVIGLTYFNSYSQKQDTTSRKHIHKYSAGNELIISSRHFYSGVGFIAGGLYVVSLNLQGGIPNNDLNYIGGILAIVGTIYMVESHSHITKAGIILNKNGIGISIPL